MNDIKRILSYEQVEACRDAIRVPGYDFAWCPHSLRKSVEEVRSVRCNYLGTGNFVFKGPQVIEQCHSPHAEQAPSFCTEPLKRCTAESIRDSALKSTKPNVIDLQSARTAKEKAGRAKQYEQISHLADHLFPE